MKIFILLFLKYGGEWIFKIQNSNNNGNNSHEIKIKTLQNERFPEDKDKYWAVDKKAGQSQWKDKYTQWLDWETH